MPQGAEQRPKAAAPSVGRPAACRLRWWWFKPLNAGVCRLHKVTPYHVGSADPGPPMARAISKREW